MPATIRDVYLQFNPLKPLEANDPRYVDCARERGVPALFMSLQLPLHDTPRPLLLSGHLGDGKTTILKQLHRKLAEEERDLVVFGEADERLDLSDVEYDDVLLAILAVLDEALRQYLQAVMEDNPFRQIWEDLSRIAQLPMEISKVDVPLGPFGKLTATVKDSPDVRLQVRQRLRQARGPTFLEVVNQYVQRAQDIVRQHGYRQVVVLLDNLDRLQDTLAPSQVSPDERLFISQAAALRSVQCHVIYTVRQALVHAQGPNLGTLYGRQPLIVPMIPVRHPDGTIHQEGMGKLREIIRRRLRDADTDFAETFSTMDAVDHLCAASGGYLRDLMTLIQNTCAEGAAAHGSLPLTDADVTMAIRSFGAVRRRVAIDYTAELEQIAQTHSLAGISSDIRQALLRQRLVYEYFFDGDYWYDICPLLRPEAV